MARSRGARRSWRSLRSCIGARGLLGGHRRWSPRPPAFQLALPGEAGVPPTRLLHATGKVRLPEGFELGSSLVLRLDPLRADSDPSR